MDRENIAGGAGITPFISIFRQLHASGKIGNSKLIFANKTRKDIILEKEFDYLLGNAFINILSDDHAKGYHHGMIDKHFLKANIPNLRQHFYLCGPPPMMDAVHEQLTTLGIKESAITTEELEVAR